MNKKALITEIRKHPEGDKLLNLGYNPSFVHKLILENEGEGKEDLYTAVMAQIDNLDDVDGARRIEKSINTLSSEQKAAAIAKLTVKLEELAKTETPDGKINTDAEIEKTQTLNLGDMLGLDGNNEETTATPGEINKGNIIATITGLKKALEDSSYFNFGTDNRIDGAIGLALIPAKLWGTIASAINDAVKVISNESPIDNASGLIRSQMIKAHNAMLDKIQQQAIASLSDENNTKELFYGPFDEAEINPLNIGSFSDENLNTIKALIEKLQSNFDIQPATPDEVLRQKAKIKQSLMADKDVDNNKIVDAGTKLGLDFGPSGEKEAPTEDGEFKLSDDFVNNAKTFADGFYDQQYLFQQGQLLKTLIKALRKEAAQEKTAALGRSSDFDKLEEQVLDVLSKMLILENEENEGFDFDNIKNSFKAIVASAVRIKKSLQRYIDFAEQGAAGAENAKKQLYKLLAQLMQLCKKFIGTLKQAQSGVLKEAEGDTPEGDKLGAGEDAAPEMTDGKRVHNFYDYIADLAQREGPYSSTEDNGMEAFKAEVQEQINNVLPALKRFPSVAPFNNPNLDNIGKDIGEYLTDYDDLIKTHLKQSLLYFKQTKANKGTTGEVFKDAIDSFGMFVAEVGALFNINVDGSTGDSEGAEKVEKGVDGIPKTGQVTEGDILDGLGLTFDENGKVNFQKDIDIANEFMQKLYKFTEKNSTEKDYESPEKFAKVIYKFIQDGKDSWFRPDRWFDIVDSKIYNAVKSMAGKLNEDVDYTKFTPDEGQQNTNIGKLFLIAFMTKIKEFFKNKPEPTDSDKKKLAVEISRFALEQAQKNDMGFSDYMKKTMGLDPMAMGDLASKKKLEQIIAKMKEKKESLSPEAYIKVLSKLSNNGTNYKVFSAYVEGHGSDPFKEISTSVFSGNPRYLKVELEEVDGESYYSPKEKKLTIVTDTGEAADSENIYYAQINSLSIAGDQTNSGDRGLSINFNINQKLDQYLKDLGQTGKAFDNVPLGYIKPEELLNLIMKKEGIPEGERPENIFGKQDIENSILVPVFEKLIEQIKQNNPDIKDYEERYNLGSIMQSLYDNLGHFELDLEEQGISLNYLNPDGELKSIKKITFLHTTEVIAKGSDAQQVYKGDFKSFFSENRFLNPENPKAFFRVNSKEEFVKLLSLFKIDSSAKITDTYSMDNIDNLNKSLSRTAALSKINFKGSRINELIVQEKNVSISTEDGKMHSIPASNTWEKLIDSLEFVGGKDLINVENEVMKNVFQKFDILMNNNIDIDDLREKLEDSDQATRFMKIIENEKLHYFHKGKWYGIKFLYAVNTDKGTMSITLGPQQITSDRTLPVAGNSTITLSNIRIANFVNLSSDFLVKKSKESEEDKEWIRKQGKKAEFYKLEDIDEQVILEKSKRIFRGENINYNQKLSDFNINGKEIKLINEFLKFNDVRFVGFDKGDEPKITKIKMSFLDQLAKSKPDIVDLIRTHGGRDRALVISTPDNPDYVFYDSFQLPGTSEEREDKAKEIMQAFRRSNLPYRYWVWDRILYQSIMEFPKQNTKIAPPPANKNEQIERKLETIIENYINNRKQQWRKRTM
jgi:hypothetical protein